MEELPLRRTIIIAASLLLATPAHADFASGRAGNFKLNLLNSPISRIMVGYTKEATAVDDDTYVTLDVYGNLSTSFERYTPTYKYTTANVSESIRLMIRLKGDSIKRFKECIALIQGNQIKREILTRLPPARGPWAQLEFYVDSASYLNDAAYWNVVSGTKVTVHVMTPDPVWFRSCTTDL